MGKFSWVKDSLIQIIFITFAVVFTVFIARISLSEQYIEYYEDKLEAKAETLVRNAGLLLTENSDIRNVAGMDFVLSVIFPTEDDGSEVIQYALFELNGQIAASSIGNIVELPNEAVHDVYTYAESPYVRSYYPLAIDGAVRYILMVQIDDTPFLDFSKELSDSLYSSLFRGCLLMGVGYALFSAISNLRKKKKPQDDTNNDTYDEANEVTNPKKNENPVNKKNMLLKLIVQLISMVACALLALPFTRINHTMALFVGILFLALAAIHLCRIMLWFVAWFSKRPISSYAAQTMQFFVFLVVFLSMYVYTIQNGYSSQIELNTQKELRISSVFAALSLSGEENIDYALNERAKNMDFGEHIESHIVIRTDRGFAVFGDDNISVSPANDLFFSAWEAQASVTGIRGGYKYGATVIANDLFETVGLAVVRQSASVLGDEMRGAMTDFLLAMSATVFAFVFLFVEMNRLLEIINIPNLKRERKWQYAKGTRSLMFLASACRYIPLYFFVLIVHDIYRHNPVSWIPGELATVLPIAVVLLVMAVGRDIAGRVIRLNSRKMMIIGCMIGIAGFMSLHFAVTLPVLLLLLVFTYTGLSMVYNGLWDFAYDAADTGYAEYVDMKENALSGEYLGGMAGAVIGAMVYDKFGLFAAFALSAVILLMLIILIRAFLPAGEKAEKAEKLELGFIGFFFSKRIIIYMFLLLMPFVLGEYFIEQFSPLYADSIALSPGAASWTSLLMTMALAYIAPNIVRLMAERLRKAVICVSANLLAAVGLFMFAVMPNIATMYAASALIGVSIGVARNILTAEYSEIDETKQYAQSGYVYNLFDSLFGLLGAALFTLAHFMSSGGEYVFVIAGIIAVVTLLYMILTKRGRNKA
jgi:MFS family permease